ncbi:MAG: methylenetetrahydrofolate--tRNA-(uracil(54)-C(5))-methyltransferase (FADH(2)-oxidizing) TrmFO [Bacilli bacterium]
MEKVKVIGAGLAGCEVAYQLAKRGIDVELYEMKPNKKSPAHKSDLFAELVCSNSLRSDTLLNAVGVLKEEMRMFDSLIMKAAEASRLPAGKALAVDRDVFSKYITDEINSFSNISIKSEEVVNINTDKYTIVATGPLTSDDLSNNILEVFGEDYLYFYDAAAPIIEADSINYDIAYFKDRYDDDNKGDYLNCPMNKEQFEAWYNELINAEVVELKEYEKEIYFAGCMPFEEMARKGIQTLLFGPMKPVGLRKTEDDKPYAVVQLRQDNVSKSLYNIVGFQTHLKWNEQKRIIQMIPGLENAEIVRYGVMHRNTFINSPNILNAAYQSKRFPKLFFAGQITGVEGYVESSASGIVSALNMIKYIKDKEVIYFPQNSIMGSMAHYISNCDPKNFQPMNANLGLLNELGFKHKKKERKELYAKRALEEMSVFISERKVS